MNPIQPNIQISVDLTNPGQFFACCGLLELADRLWPGAEGWFDVCRGAFLLGRHTGEALDPDRLITTIASCPVRNTMSPEEVERREELGGLLKQLRREIKSAADEKKKELQQRQEVLDTEKKNLDRQWRERPVELGSPFNLQVDWFLDSFAGGSRFKTWAGQQSVIDIFRAMHAAIADSEWAKVDCMTWLKRASADTGVPFNFDSNLGPQASSVDVGYSLDALNLSIQTRPFIEFAAFIGLQRFRPCQIGNENRYRYRMWSTPLPLSVASIAACTFLSVPDATDFEFRLLYRTKYLKSFLPSTIAGAST